MLTSGQERIGFHFVNKGIYIHFLIKIQSTLVISTSVISNNRFSKRKSGPCFNTEI